MWVASLVLEFIPSTQLVILDVAHFLIFCTYHEQSWLRGVRTFSAVSLLLLVFNRRAATIDMIEIEPIVVRRWSTIFYLLHRSEPLTLRLSRDTALKGAVPMLLTTLASSSTTITFSFSSRSSRASFWNI